MKRWFFIIGGIIIALLITVWVYLLLNGTPTKEELFNALSFGDTQEELVVIDNPVVTPPPTEEQKKALRQLTTRRVAGYQEAQTSSSSLPLVYFVEAGTGHVYSVSPDGQNENRASNLTIPQTIEAAISSDASYAVVKTTDPSNLTIVTLPNGASELSSFILNETALPGFSITSDGMLLFTVKSGGGLVGKRFNLKTKVTEMIFSVPFTEGTVVWGKTATSSNYVYPKTNRSLEGFLYEIKKGSLARLPAAGFGFGALSSGQHTIFMNQTENVFKSYVYTHASKTTQELVFALIPEKCAFLNTSPGALCAYSDISTDVSFPDSWYKGLTSFSDEIWQVTFDSTETTFASLIDTLSVSGREIDIITPVVNQTDTLFYFKNKNDQTLWVFEPSTVVE